MVYKEGFHTGKMNQTAASTPGCRSMEAKETHEAEMLAPDEADLFYDLSEKVICRCGEPVVIKKVADQWFIDYANPKRHRPDQGARQEHAASSLGVLYRTSRACWTGSGSGPACARATGSAPGSRSTRSGSSRPSPIPPSIRSTTLISHYVNDGSLRPEQMTEEFFDYVLLGKGDLDAGGPAHRRRMRAAGADPGRRATTGTRWTSTWAARST